MSDDIKFKDFEDVNDFWENFEKFILTHKNFIWRGQASSEWKLHSSWYRHFSEKKKDFSLKGLREFIKNFEIYLARGGIFPFKDKEKKSFYSWLKYARHYGLPAPLIDFTYSPYVALFFACSEEPQIHKQEIEHHEKNKDSHCKKDKYFVLYAINIELFRKLFFEKKLKPMLINFKEKVKLKEFKDYLSNFITLNEIALNETMHFPDIKLWKIFKKTLRNVSLLELGIIDFEKETQKLLRFSEPMNEDCLTNSKNFSLLNKNDIEICKKILEQIENILLFDPSPESFNTRMIRQQGCFIYDTMNYQDWGVEDLEEFIKEKINSFNKEKENSVKKENQSSDCNKEDAVLCKWIVCSEFKKEIIKKLDLMNINGISLYGDEAGAVLDTKLKDNISFKIADSKIDFD